jgi:hypothetical protein
MERVFKMATKAIPPPPHPTPVVTFVPGPASIQRNQRIWKSANGFWPNLQATSFRDVHGIFPISANSLVTLKLMIFSRNFLNETDA